MDVFLVDKTCQIKCAYAIFDLIEFIAGICNILAPNTIVIWAQADSNYLKTAPIMHFEKRV
jgi:hypothetical protein